MAPRFSLEQTKLLVKTCLLFDAEIRESNEPSSTDLWKRITEQMLAQDANIKKFTKELLQQKYNEQREWYEKVKNLLAKQGRTWSAQWRIHADVYELFKQHDSAKTEEYSNELKEFVLKARLALEAEFQECPKRDPQRTILWQKVLRQVNAKDMSKAKLTLAQVQSIYADFLKKYKNIKSGAEANGSSNVWPYFEQIDKVYGNYALDAIILEEVVADIDDDDEDKDFESAYDNHEDELDMKMDYDEFYDNDDDVDEDDDDEAYDYEFDQSDTDSNIENISNISDLREYAEKTDNQEIKAFLAEQDAADRKMFQQIMDIENEKVQLQKEKMEELEKIRILLEQEELDL